ncbi:MAG: citrate lyase holo-[acyl-carrier protein] synthase, partial [Lachnospiraceae bacterium]|nr:citrate lyase holo-[acyl-carrier protein] synthase [Lachnospiraceae bacterium]
MGSSNAVTIEAILNAREERAKRQKLWLDETRVPLVSCTMNTAGAVKDSVLIRETFSALTDDLEKALAGLPILKEELLFYPTGPECLFAVDADPMELKRRCIAVEEATPAGRLLDADVMDRNGRSISRTLLGKPERSCLVCGKPGRACAAGQVHPIEEVRSASERRMKAYLLGREPEEAADRAVRALIREVHVTPKPGLVDENNSGSHSDMDLALMEQSARSLRPYFETCVRTGLETAAKAPEETFPPLRAAGLEAERTMFAATRGVNTHKGAIYLFGILLGAYGRLWKPGGALPIETVLTEAGRVSAQAVREDLARIDVTPDAEQTSGQKFY